MLIQCVYSCEVSEWEISFTWDLPRLYWDITCIFCQIQSSGQREKQRECFLVFIFWEYNLFKFCITAYSYSADVVWKLHNCSREEYRMSMSVMAINWGHCQCLQERWPQTRSYPHSLQLRLYVNIEKYCNWIYLSQHPELVESFHIF